MGVVGTGAVVSPLCLSGEYGNLLDMVSFVVVIFYVHHHRNIYPEKETTECRTSVQSVRISGTASYLCDYGVYVLHDADHLQTTIHVAGLIITLAGIPIYFWVMRNKKGAATRWFASIVLQDLPKGAVHSQVLFALSMINRFSSVCGLVAWTSLNRLPEWVMHRAWRTWLFVRQYRTVT